MQRLMMYRRDGNLLHGYTDHGSTFSPNQREYWQENVTLNFEIMKRETGIDAKTYQATAGILGELAGVMDKVKHAKQK